MINVFVEGSSWPEVAQELRKMLGEERKPSQDTTDLVNAKECVIEDLQLQLDNAEEQLLEVTSEYTNKVNGYEELLRVKDARIADLENQLKEKNTLICDKDIKISNLLANIEEDGKIITELKLQLADAEAANPTPADATTADTETTAPATGSAPVKTEEEQTEIPEVTEAPVKEYKKEEVRAILVKCRAANIALTEILAPYGGSLGAVKPEDYAKVMADAEAALEGK